LPKVVLL